MTIRFVIAILTVAVPTALSSQASDGARTILRRAVRGRRSRFT
jgi:hypothetical protein